MKRYLLKGEISTISKLSATLSQKSVSVTVELVVSNLEDLSDEEIKLNKILLENNKGYKTSGLLFFDIFKSTRNFSDLPVKENANYRLKLFKHNSVTTFPIIVIKKENEIEIGDNNFRFYYSFYQIEKCVEDGIFLFEDEFNCLKNPRLFRFTATRFDSEVKTGLVNTSNFHVCKRIVEQKLKDSGFIADENQIYDLKLNEIVFDDNNVFFN